jgi:metal-dependent amidase/aminoacylase/carboxypeptidase family protein
MTNREVNEGTMKPLQRFPRLHCPIFYFALCAFVWAQSPSEIKEVDSVYPEAYALYLDLHQHPELSSQETQTSAKLTNRLRTLGYEVTDHVGGNGIVAILRNGSGPTIMLRTDLDALPVEEKTDVVYNDPALAEKLRTPLASALGQNNVVTAEASTGSEDFAYFIGERIRSFYFVLGSANPQKLEEAKIKGEYLPDNHSSLFVPDVEPTLRTGIAAEVAVFRSLLK